MINAGRKMVKVFVKVAAFKKKFRTETNTGYIW